MAQFLSCHPRRTPSPRPRLLQGRAEPSKQRLICRALIFQFSLPPPLPTGTWVVEAVGGRTNRRRQGPWRAQNPERKAFRIRMSKSNFVSGTAFFFAVKQGQSCPPYRRDEIMRGLIIIILIQAWVQVLWGLKLIPFGGASSRRRIKIHKYEIEHDRKCLLRRKKSHNKWQAFRKTANTTNITKSRKITYFIN